MFVYELEYLKDIQESGKHWLHLRNSNGCHGDRDRKENYISFDF
jgi:hypothetical protein